MAKRGGRGRGNRREAADGRDAPEVAAVPPPPTEAELDARAVARRHLKFGWLLLCISLPAGLILEALHGFKVTWYLGPDAELRRLLFTLAHAHGTLLALLNIAYGLTAVHLGLRSGLAGRMLMVGAILLPAGFLGGGVVTYGGDPGPTVVLAPIGGVLLAAAILVIGRNVLSATASEPAGAGPRGSEND